jgi:23S rRNA pseudouridine1911/1915/1917 synthase
MPEWSGIVGEGFDGSRVDSYLTGQAAGLTRSQLQQRNPLFFVNDRQVKASHRLRAGDRLLVRYDSPPAVEVSAEQTPLDILYEDESVIVLNKPAGMVVHPAHGNFHGTLMQGLLYYLAGLDRRFEGSPYHDRPGIVHRLDKDTSGVLIAAKNPEALEQLAGQFRARTTKKVYLAVVKGVPRNRRGVIDGNIRRDPAHRKRFEVSENRGKPSRTRYRVVRELGGYSLLELRPVTGRTHQLRVHLKHIGTPVLGDPIYGRRDTNFPDLELMLHAYRLTITTPDGITRTYRAPLPERFRRFLAAVRSKR